MTGLRRLLVALLLTGLISAWALPASAQELEPTDGPDTTETVVEEPVLEEAPGVAPEPDVDQSAEAATPPVTPPVATTTAAPAVDASTEVTGVELRWGINNESNNRAFAPGTFNFLSAGKVQDPGAGGQTLTTASQGAQWSNGNAGGWSASSGSVSVETWNGSSYAPATWGGLSSDETGTTIPSATSGTFSQHQLVFGGGSGTIDRAAGTASLSWDGDATVLYYSGMTFFYLSDPQLQIADGRGTLTAELSGFSSSMEDLSVWGPLAPRRVPIATFAQASLTPEDVLSLTPDYAGVENGLSEQVTSGDVWGSFPQEFVDFQVEAGAAAYWFSSGGSADRFKIPHAVHVLVTSDATPPGPGEGGNPDPGGPGDPGTEEPPPVDPGPTAPDGTVSDVVLRWGINDESNNRAFAPGTFNFLSAGKVTNPRAGGQTLTNASSGTQWSNGTRGGWSASSGNVAVQKWNGSAYQPSTWAGLSTDETGATIPSATSGRFSKNQLVFNGGTGTVDRAAGTASLSWDGDATVLYYSGMTFFYLSDPQLKIAGGRGTLTAELSGYASSMDDVTQWNPVAPVRVSVATFARASISANDVLTLTPDYRGVDSGVAGQVRSGDSWGSFPRGFIDFQRSAGAAAYWYSSGGSADKFKVAQDVTVLLTPDAVPPAPQASAGSGSGQIPTNLARNAPVTPLLSPLASIPAPAAAYVSAGDHGWMLGRTPVSEQLVWWLLTAALLTMAASTVTASAVYVRRLRPTT